MRPRLLMLCLLVFSLAQTAAASITITNPSGVYSTDAIPVDIVSGDGYNLTGYTITESDISRSLSGTSEHGSERVPDGNLTLTATATNGTDTIEEQQWFLVDTAPPTVIDTQPTGQVVSSLQPNISFIANDLSQISSTEMKLDGSAVDLSRRQNNKTGHYTPSNALTEGEHTVTVTLSDEHGHDTSTSWTFTLPENPLVTLEQPGTVVDEEAFTLRLRVQDPSGIDEERSEIDIEYGGEELDSIALEDLDRIEEKYDYDDAVRWARYEHTVDGLESGTYRIDADIRDTAGNRFDDDWAVTVDTVQPELSLVSHQDGAVVRDRELFVVAASDAHTAVEDVTFKLGDETRVRTGTDDGRYRASFDTRDLANRNATLYIQAEDEAGNTRATGMWVVVDNRPPVLDPVEVYPETATERVLVSAAATDNESRVRNMSYQVGENEGGITADDAGYDERQETGTAVVDVSDLDTGTHSVRVTVTDAAGHETVKEDVVHVNHSLAASLDVSVAERINITVGETVAVPITVQNNGDVDERVIVSLDTSLNASLLHATKRLRTGETREFQMTVTAAQDASYGPRNLTVEATGLAAALQQQVTATILPPIEERRRIRHRFTTLKQNFSTLAAERSGYGDGFGNETVTATFTRTETLLADIEASMSSGRYDVAASLLDDAQHNVQHTDQVFTGAVVQHRYRQTWASAVKAFLGLLVLGLVFGAYRFLPEYMVADRNPGHADRSLQDQITVGVQQLRKKLAALVEDREEQVSGWSGYGN